MDPDQEELAEEPQADGDPNQEEPAGAEEPPARVPAEESPTEEKLEEQPRSTAEQPPESVPEPPSDIPKVTSNKYIEQDRLRQNQEERQQALSPQGLESKNSTIVVRNKVCDSSASTGIRIPAENSGTGTTRARGDLHY